MASNPTADVALELINSPGACVPKLTAVLLN